MQVGDVVADTEFVIRRLRKRHIQRVGNDCLVDIEAFRPIIRGGQLETTVSCDVESLLEVPIPEDGWSTHPTDKRGACRISAMVPGQRNYPVIYDAHPTNSHCGITNTTPLLTDDLSLKVFADNSDIVHDPWK